MDWSKIVWFQIWNLKVWAGSGVGKSAQQTIHVYAAVTINPWPRTSNQC